MLKIPPSLTPPPAIVRIPDSTLTVPVLLKVTSKPPFPVVVFLSVPELLKLPIPPPHLTFPKVPLCSSKLLKLLRIAPSANATSVLSTKLASKLATIFPVLLSWASRTLSAPTLLRLTVNVPIWVIGTAESKVPLSQRVPFKVVALAQTKLLAMINLSHS